MTWECSVCETSIFNVTLVHFVSSTRIVNSFARATSVSLPHTFMWGSVNRSERLVLVSWCISWRVCACVTATVDIASPYSICPLHPCPDIASPYIICFKFFFLFFTANALKIVKIRHCDSTLNKCLHRLIRSLRLCAFQSNFSISALHAYFTRTGKWTKRCER